MLHLTHTTITVTHRCTLKCKLCASYSPHFSPTPHFDIDLLKRTVDAYFEVVDFVDKFTMSGGEPMCHSELDQLVSYLHKYADKIGTAEIITNGTIVPKDSLVDALKLWGKQINLMVDNYGELSCQLEQVRNVLDEAGVPYRVRCYFGEDAHMGGWVDYGDFSQKRSSVEDLKKQYETCVHPKSICIWELRGGQMHICARAHTMMYLGIIPDNPEEYLNLLDDSLSVEEKREKILKLQKLPYLSSCGYCNGMYNEAERFTPAEQMEE